ncbi:MAG: CBS domain-containing protein [Chloroflexota bacterium]
MKVAEVMTRDVVTAQPDASIREVAELMASKNVGTVIITDGGGRLQGIATDREIVTDCLAKGCDPSSSRIQEIMTGEMPGGMGLATASPDMDILDAARELGMRKVRRLPVVEDDRVVGIVSEADLAGPVKEAIDGLLKELAKAER